MPHGMIAVIILMYQRLVNSYNLIYDTILHIVKIKFYEEFLFVISLSFIGTVFTIVDEQQKWQLKSLMMCKM